MYLVEKDFSAVMFIATKAMKLIENIYQLEISVQTLIIKLVETLEM